MARSLKEISLGKARGTTSKDQHLCHLGAFSLLMLALLAGGFDELPQQNMLPRCGGQGWFCVGWSQTRGLASAAEEGPHFAGQLVLGERL